MSEFSEFLIESEWQEYNDTLAELIESLENTGELNEGLIDSLTKKMKGGVDFIRQFAELVGGNLLDILKAFKNKVLFTFFSKIKWSISELVKLVKKGYNLQRDLKKAIAKYIAESGVAEFTADNLKDLDAWLAKYPWVKRAGTLVVVGFLIYQWTEMISFTGDFAFDFDQTVLFEAIKGNFSLADLFASPSGIEMLLFIALGTLTGATFPWPGPTWALFAASIVYTLSKDKYPALAKGIIRNAKKLKSIKV